MPHHTSELCSNPDCNHARSSHVANRMLCCIVGCSCSQYVEVIHGAEFEPFKPFLPGVEVYTAYGKGVIDDIALVSDDHCPYIVNMADGRKRFFKRENLSMNPANAPKLVCNCDAIAGFHNFECPLALSEPVESQTEILHTEPVRFTNIAIVPGALVALDRDGRIWKMPFHNEQWVMINSPVKE